jgi:hypothetical protein
LVIMPRYRNGDAHVEGAKTQKESLSLPINFSKLKNNSKTVNETAIDCRVFYFLVPHSQLLNSKKKTYMLPIKRIHRSPGDLLTSVWK